MLRDSTLIPHVMWFEYTSSRSEARYSTSPTLLRTSLDYSVCKIIAK